MIDSLRIGVAEDEPDLQEFYQIVITELGYDVAWIARNGVELIEKFEQDVPDLMIVDIKMPALDGLDAVRAATRDTTVPIIVVSGHHDDQTMARAEAQKMIMGYLIKPIREADLKTSISVAMHRSEELQRRYREEDEQKITDAAQMLMEKGKMSQQQALGHLQQLASKRHRSLVEIAESIINSDGEVEEPVS